MNKITRILAVIMAIAMVFSLTACGDDPTPEVNNTIATVGSTDASASVCEVNGHTWLDATYQTPKTCSVCAVTEGEAMFSYNAEYGLEEKLLDKSGVYDLEICCAQDPTKTTVAKVTVDGYETITSDENHEALEGYEWKVVTFKLHFDDENAWNYGASGVNYLWDDRYIGDPADASTDNTGLFENGISQNFLFNGIEYREGLLRIEESVTGWMKDDAGTNYIDIYVTVSVRVPAGYDGFVFGLETTGWEWTDGAYLHEVITENTLLFCFD